MARYKIMDVNEFTVIQYFKGGGHENVREHVSGEEAVKAFYHYTNNVASKVGITERVIIVDYGDCVNMEWQHGKGITFPLGDHIDEDMKKIVVEYHLKDDGE